MNSEEKINESFREDHPVDEIKDFSDYGYSLFRETMKTGYRSGYKSGYSSRDKEIEQMKCCGNCEYSKEKEEDVDKMMCLTCYGKCHWEMIK